MSTQDNSAGGKYHIGGRGTEESIYEITEWSLEETEELATNEEAETAGGMGDVRLTMVVTAGELEGSGVEVVSW